MTTHKDALEVGQKVRLLADIYEHADDCHPGGYLAHKDEVLIVRRISSDLKVYPVSVSHEHIKDRSFGVAYDEIEVVK